MAGSIASLFVDIGANTRDFESGLSRVSGGLTGFASKAMSVGAGLGGWVQTAEAALHGMGKLFGPIASGVMGTNAALETSGAAWGVLLGSTDKAQEKLAQLFDFGAKTPFEFEEVDKASRLLQTFGGNALNTMGNLTMVGNAASATGYRFQDVAFWTARLYDSLTNGQPIGEAMMNLQQMGVVSGETRNKLEALQESGAKGPELWAAYAASQERFTGMMEQQSTTFTGRLSTMKDSFNMLLAQAGKPIFDKVSAGLGRFNELLASPALADFVSKVSSGLVSAFGTVGSVIGAVVPKVQGLGTIFGSVFKAFASGDFNGAFGPILAGLDQLSSGAGTKLAGFVSKVLSVFQVVRDAAITFGQALSGDWQGGGDTRINGTVKLFGNLGLAIRAVADWFTGTALPAATAFFGWLQSAFGKVMSVVGPFIAGFGAVIAAIGGAGVAFGAIAAVAMPIIAVIGSALAFLLSPIGLIAAAVGLLAAAWVNDWGGIREIVAGIMPTLAQLWTSIQAGFTAALPVLQQVWAAIQAAAAAAIPMLLQGFAMVQAGIAAAIPYLTQFGQFIITAFQAAAPIVIALGAAIMTGIGGAFAVIGPLVQGFASAFMSSLPAIQGLWAQLVGVWQSAQGVIGALAPVLQLVAGIIGGVLIAAVGMALASLGGLVGFFTGALPGAIQMASGLLQIVQGNFQLLAAVITGVVGIVSNVLQGDWSGAWQAAQQMVTGVVAAITTIVSGMATAVTGFFQGLVSGVSGMISGFVATITGYFTALTADSSNQVSQLVSQVLNWFQQLPGRVGSAMASLASTVTGALSALVGSAASAAAGIGNAIIDGISGAIRAGAGQLLSAITGVVGGLIEGAKNVLKIHSPSSVADRRYDTGAGRS